MPKKANQKLRILYVRQILREFSDENHYLTVQDIIDKLEQLYGVTAERKSVMDDLAALEDYGDQIVRRAGRAGGCAMLEREFQQSELKLLIDMVQSSNFITEKKSAGLIKTLSGFCSKSESSALKRHVFIADRPKSDNETIFYQLDALNRAITDGRQVTFLYFDYDMDKRKVYRHEGARYRVSPWELTVDDGKYYLVASDVATGNVRHYRVDKMEKVKELESRSEQPQLLAEDNPAKYAKRVFGMFGGNALTVVLRCDADMAHVIYDRFGMDEVTPRPVNRAHTAFECGVRVVPSEQFFGWIASLGGKVRITAPADVRQTYLRFLRELLAGEEQAL